MPFRIHAAREVRFADLAAVTGRPYPWSESDHKGWIATLMNPDGGISFASRLDTEVLWYVDSLITVDGEAEWDHPFGSRTGHTLHIAPAEMREILNERVKLEHHARDRAAFARQVTAAPHPF